MKNTQQDFLEQSKCMLSLASFGFDLDSGA